MNTPEPNVHGPAAPRSHTNPMLMVFAWAVVSIPLAWGISQTVAKALPLFQNAASAAPTTSPSAR